MRKIIYIVLSVMLFSCSNEKSQENEEIAKNDNNKIASAVVEKNNKEKVVKSEKFDPKRDADKNKDGIINGKDWVRLSRSQRYKLVEYYTDLTYKSLGINPAKDIKEKEVNGMISKLDYHYTGLKSYTSGEKNIDIYELMLSAK